MATQLLNHAERSDENFQNQQSAPTMSLHQEPRPLLQPIPQTNPLVPLHTSVFQATIPASRVPNPQPETDDYCGQKTNT